MVHAVNRIAIGAMSGRHGKKLWTAMLPLTDDSSTWFVLGNSHLAGHVLEAGKGPDVLLIYQRLRHVKPGDPPGNSVLLQTWLVRLSGRDGKIVWEQALGDYGNLDLRQTKIPVATADLDGDGVKDILFWLPVAPAGPSAAEQSKQQAGNMRPRRSRSHRGVRYFELRAYSGRDGKLLWACRGSTAMNQALRPPSFA